MCAGVWAARPECYYNVEIAPAGGSWVLNTGQKARFEIRVTENNIPTVGKVDFELSYDCTEPFRKGEAKLKDGVAIVDAGTMKKPGFLRCKAIYRTSEREYTALGTIGFEPEAIEACVEMPADFDAFWATALEQARKVDLKPRFTPLPDQSTDDVEVSMVSWQFARNGCRMYGVLATPKGEGPFPAVIQYPGAGVYAIGPNLQFARRGLICLSVEIHGIPTNLPSNLYSDLGAGALNLYSLQNINDRDSYYYRRVIQGAVTAVDLVLSLPSCNGDVAVYGGSQGGYLSTVVAALHPSVKFASIHYPAMSDHVAYAKGSSGSWPHALKGQKLRSPEVINTLAYYDTVNFARRLDKPCIVAFGFNDLTCSPTACYSVYNAIQSPKTLVTAPLAGHFLLDRQYHTATDAVVEALTR